MVAPSKLFSHPINCYHCSQFVLHPGIGCLRFFLKNLFWHGVGGLKYFSPLLFTPLVLRLNSMNRDLFKHIVQHYSQTVFWSTLATASVFLWVCCLRNTLGNFRIYTTLFLPTVLGLQFCWFFPTRVIKLFTTATSQAVLEGLLTQYSNKFTNLILHSPSVQTILFMLNSAVILHYKRKNNCKEYWFIETHEKLNETTRKAPVQEMQDKNEVKVTDIYCTEHEKSCHHINVSCRKFVLDGMRSYLVYGIPLDLLAIFMKTKFTQRSEGFLEKIGRNMKKFRPYMTGFFLSYVGIYRLSCCLLRKYYGHLSLDLQHIVAAFLGGVSYICVKRVNFVILSIVTSIQILWQRFCSSLNTTKSIRKPNLVIMILKNAPLSQIILPINCGYLVHNYIFNYHLVNSLAKGFLDGLTRDKLKNLRNVVTKNDLQTLIEMGKSHSVKTFL